MTRRTFKANTKAQKRHSRTRLSNRHRDERLGAATLKMERMWKAIGVNVQVLP